MIGLGIAINTAGIFLGGAFGLFRKKPLSPSAEASCKTILGGGAVLLGLYLVWKNLNGTFLSMVGQFFLVMIAMSLGKLLGKALGLQKMSNRLGQIATSRIPHAAVNTKNFNDGFLVTALLACANPLGIFAAVLEAFSEWPHAFLLKALLDGLAALTFAVVFGPGVLLAALPVLAWQGTIFLLLKTLAPWLAHEHLLESILMVDGFLLCSVSVVIFGVRKVELADYLPALVLAPLFTWLCRHFF